MELVNILILVSAIVVLLLLWLIIGVRHLKHLKGEVSQQWELVDEGLRKRQDLVPNLIETVKIFVPNQEQFLEQIIQERQRAAKEYQPSAGKIEFEHDLSASLGKIFDMRRDARDLATDTNFLELKKEISDLSKNVHEKTKKYNEMVRYYNKHRKSFLLSPIARVFKYGNLDIFEMER